MEPNGRTWEEVARVRDRLHNLSNAVQVLALKVQAMETQIQDEERRDRRSMSGWQIVLMAATVLVGAASLVISLTK